jgi:hypothetical protein
MIAYENGALGVTLEYPNWEWTCTSNAKIMRKARKPRETLPGGHFAVTS